MRAACELLGAQSVLGGRPQRFIPGGNGADFEHTRGHADSTEFVPRGPQRCRGSGFPEGELRGKGDPGLGAWLRGAGAGQRPLSLGSPGFSSQAPCTAGSGQSSATSSCAVPKWQEHLLYGGIPGAQGHGQRRWDVNP